MKRNLVNLLKRMLKLERLKCQNFYNNIMKKIILLTIVSIILVAGCTQQQTALYVCSDGSTVSSPSLCPSTQ